MKPLTDVDYWEENWWRRERPRLLRLYRDFDIETIRLLGPQPGTLAAVREHPPPRVLEIGAGASRVLPYLGWKFGYEVFGSDFSTRGCLLLRANLALRGVPARVVCEDFLRSSLPAESFDLLYSSGLIEHFDDTRQAIAEHLRFLKPGGRLVLIVPNLVGVQGEIVRRLAKSLWDLHRPLSPEDLAAHLGSLGLEKVRCGYLGSFFLHIGRDPHWLGARAWPGWFRWLAQQSARASTGFLSLLFGLSPWRPHSRLLSPGVFAMGNRPAAKPE